MRIQFYPSPDLEAKLTAESTTLGIQISQLVNDILNKHYGLIPPFALTEIEIEKKVFQDVRKYIDTLPPNKEFSLLDASTTFQQVEMVYAGKPYVLRARIGKKFAKMAGGSDFPNIKQVFVDGKPKRTVETRAAVYVTV